jgi:hypothetical protein
LVISVELWLGAGPSQLGRQLLKGHETVDSLLGSAAQVFDEQGPVDVLLVRFDHGIRLDPEPAKNRRIVHGLPARHDLQSTRFGGACSRWRSLQAVSGRRRT